MERPTSLSLSQQQQQQQQQQHKSSNGTLRSISAGNLVTSPSRSYSRTQTAAHIPLSSEAIVIVDKVEAPPPAPPPTAVVTEMAAVTSSPTRRAAQRSTNSRYNVEAAELPAPDTVRQVKRIFENVPGRSNAQRRSQSAGPGVNRIPLTSSSTSSLMSKQTADKFNVQRKNLENSRNVQKTPRIVDLVPASTKPQPMGPKPAVLSPKPSSSALPRGRSTNSRTPVPVPVPVPVPAPAAAAAPLSVSLPVTVPVAFSDPVAVSSSPVAASLAASPAVAAQDATGEDHQGIRAVTKTALDNIRSESSSVKFNFDDKKSSSTCSSSSSTCSSSSNSPSAQHKQIGVIRPQLKSPLTATAEEQVNGSADVVDKKNELKPDVGPFHSFHFNFMIYHEGN